MVVLQYYFQFPNSAYRNFACEGVAMAMPCMELYLIWILRIHFFLFFNLRLNKIFVLNCI